MRISKKGLLKKIINSNKTQFKLNEFELAFNNFIKLQTKSKCLMGDIHFGELKCPTLKNEPRVYLIASFYKNSSCLWIEVTTNGKAPVLENNIDFILQSTHL